MVNAGSLWGGWKIYGGTEVALALILRGFLSIGGVEKIECVLIGVMVFWEEVNKHVNGIRECLEEPLMLAA